MLCTQCNLREASYEALICDACEKKNELDVKNKVDKAITEKEEEIYGLSCIITRWFDYLRVYEFDTVFSKDPLEVKLFSNQLEIINKIRDFGYYYITGKFKTGKTKLVGRCLYNYFAKNDRHGISVFPFYYISAYKLDLVDFDNPLIIAADILVIEDLELAPPNFDVRGLMYLLKLRGDKVNIFTSIPDKGAINKYLFGHINKISTKFAL